MYIHREKIYQEEYCLTQRCNRMTHDRRSFLRAIGVGSLGVTAATLSSGTTAATTIITICGGGADIWTTKHRCSVKRRNQETALY